MRDAIHALILAVVMALSFWVGDSYGLKRAPEYVEMKKQDDARFAEETARINAEYEWSEDHACNRMIDIAQEYLAAPMAPPPDPRDR